MKKFFSLFLILALLCSCVVVSNAATPSVSVSSNKTAIDKGDTVTISVNIASGSNLYGIKFKVEYNTSDFEYVENSASASSIFMVEPNDRNKGYIIYSGVAMSPVTTGGTLMSFKLKALNYGGKISITIIEALDENDNETTVKATGLTLKCAHSNIKWNVTKKATCTEKGIETGICDCGYTGTREIPKNEHTVGDYKVTKEPTCTEKGAKQAVCAVCNKEFTEEIKALGHTYGKWVVEKEATETEKGLKKAECSLCGDIKEQIIPVINKETESSTEKPIESTTFIENTTDEITTQEITTEESSNQASSNNIEEKPSTSKTVILTIVSVLAVEAVIAGAVILIVKQRKKEKEQ